MSNILSTLKVKFSSDTSELKKGADQGAAAIEDLTERGKSSMSDLAGMIGVDISKISAQITSFSAVLKSLGTGFGAAATGSGGLSAALKILRVAIISTGIGAIVVALGSLVAYFTSTERGANKLSEKMAALGAIFSVIVDRLSLFGEKIYEAFANPKEAIADLWASLKTYVVDKFEALIGLFGNVGDAFSALWDRDWDKLKTAASDAAKNFMKLNPVVDVVKGTASAFADMGAEMADEATKAEKLKKELNALEIQEREMAVTSKQREATIAKLKYLVEDVTAAENDRIDAASKARQLQQAMLNDERRIASERVRILAQQQDLSENTAADYQALADAKIALADVDARIIERMIEMNNKFNQLNGEIIKRRQEQDAYLKAIKPESIIITPEFSADGVQSTGKAQQFIDIVPTVDYGSLIPDTKKAFKETSAIITANMAKATEGVDEFAYASQTSIINMSDAINSAFDGMAMAIGESIGNMMAGTEGIAGIGTAVLSALAEMLITVGKMAIATGIAVIGIKEALMSLNPAVAIAAGIALVALGTAVKAGLSSAASGGSGGMSSVSAPVTSVDTRTASNTSQSNTASIAVEVTGEFRQRGADLVAVVGKENNRKTLTT